MSEGIVWGRISPPPTRDGWPFFYAYQHLASQQSGFGTRPENLGRTPSAFLQILNNRWMKWSAR